jgi:hypothetical protein
MELSDVQYDAAECPPDLKAGRIGGAFGGTASKEVSQQCVKVSCRVNNPTDKPLKDVAVFGFVLDEKVCWRARAEEGGGRRQSSPPTLACKHTFVCVV